MKSWTMRSAEFSALNSVVAILEDDVKLGRATKRTEAIVKRARKALENIPVKYPQSKKRG